MLKKLTAAGLVLLLAIIILSGCRSPQLYEKKLTLEDFEKESEQTWYITGVQGKDKVQVTLYANPSTGYIWRVSETVERSTLVKDGSPLYQPPTEGLMGAAGTELWKFKVTGRGASFVSLEYLREFEADKGPLWTLDIIVE